MLIRVFAQVLEMVSIIEQEEEERTKDNKVHSHPLSHPYIPVIKNISNYHLIIQEDDNEDDMSIEDEEPTPIDNDDSEEESKASTESDDPFNWLWMPICDCPVHVSVACVQVSKELHTVLVVSI